MSAAEIIEQIRALPERDFRIVAAFIDERRRDESISESSGEVRPGFHEAAHEVFGRYDDLFRELAK